MLVWIEGLNCNVCNFCECLGCLSVERSNVVQEKHYLVLQDSFLLPLIGVPRLGGEKSVLENLGPILGPIAIGIPSFSLAIGGGLQQVLVRNFGVFHIF